MSHPLQRELSSLRFKLRLQLVLFGLAWVVAAPLLAATVLCLLDYLVHFEDRGIRIICTLVTLGVLGWTGYRFLWRGLAARFDDLDLALRVEAQFPELGDQFASAVEFLKQPAADPAAGSPELRQAVVAQTLDRIGQLEIDRVLNPRPLLRALAMACIVGLSAALLFALDSRSALVALERLANPLGHRAWPKRNHLVLRETITRAALRGPVEIAVIDAQNRPLPDEVRLHIRYAGSTQVQVIPMRFAAGAMIHRIESLTRPFEYRAEGGDDNTMPWVHLEVVEPPSVESLSLTLHPPAYASAPPWNTRKEFSFRALAGTGVELSGTATKPLRAAWLCLDDGTEIPLHVSSDSYGFSLALAPPPGDSSAGGPASSTSAATAAGGSAEPAGPPRGFIVRKSGTYSFKLEDGEGFAGVTETQYEMRAVPDLAPTASVILPDADSFVTSVAEVPVEVHVKDDLAIHAIHIRYTRSDQSDQGEKAVEIHVGPEVAPPQPAGLQGALPGQSLTVKHVWKLADLKLPAGAQLSYFATADDYLPQRGQSPSRRLTIITPDELLERIAEKQTFILGELARILDSQRQARSLLGDVQIQLNDVGQLTKADYDRLQGAELTQRQVNRALTSPQDGVPAQIQRLLEDLVTNRVDSPEVNRRMEDLRNALGELERDVLPGINHGLTAALKQAQQTLAQPRPQGDAPRTGQPAQKQPTGQPASAGPSAAKPAAGSQPRENQPPARQPSATQPQATQPQAAQTAENPPPQNQATADQQIRDNLDDVASGQEQVIAGLEQMLGELKQWDNYRSFAREITGLAREHEGIAAETKQLGQQTLTKDFKDLTPQQQADLKKLGHRQQDLARRLDIIQQRMEQMSGTLQQDDPLASGVLSDALHHARDQGLSSQLRQAGRNIADNQVGQATQRQQQIGEDLSEMLDILANRREHELSRLVKKLKEAEAELENLRQKQQGLRKRMKQAEQNPNEAERRRELERLTRQQRQLQEETERFARKLQRLQAQQAGNKAAGASRNMSQAGQQAEQGDAAGAEQAAQQAEQDLDEAQQELAQQRRAAERDLAMEQLAKIQDSLQGLHGQQQTVVDETIRLQAVLQKEQKLTRGQTIALRDLARQEAALDKETRQLASKLAEAQVFNLVLRSAADEMELAANLLSRQDLSSATLAAEQRALKRFQQLLDAMKPSPKKNGQGQEQQPGEQPEGQPGDQAPTDGIPAVAQLKLLKILQEEVKLRTEELNQKLGNKVELTEAELREHAMLARQQGELADLILNLSKPSQPDPESDLDKFLAPEQAPPGNKPPAPPAGEIP
jgi:hypothetical protein